MVERKTFQIHLDARIIDDFDRTLDEHEHISEQLSFVGEAFAKKCYKGVPAWDCICACVSRIRDTVTYLNDQELGSMRYGSAFDFINFISNAAVMLDCIDMLAKITGVDLSEEDARAEAFHQLGKNGKGSDRKYFEFLRALCAVHPMETSRFKGMYQEADIVTCPHLTWVRGTPMELTWDCDLHANAFVNDASSWGEDICIHMNQVFSYIGYRYGLLGRIGAALERFQEDKIREFRSGPVPERGESESELEYIERLKIAETERFGANNDFVYEFAKKAISFVPSNPANRDASKRYANAWRFALELQRNVLQDMSRKGKSHAGIDGDETDWVLFENLEHIHCNCEELAGFGYQLEKIGYLDGSSSPRDAAWGRMKLGELESVFRGYVTMDLSHDSDEELYMLSCIALYEIALRHDCEVSRAIPHNKAYRVDS
jgi:hypothetical protein